MSVDYESLLEFEDSLRTSISSLLLLQNLQLKMDSNRVTSFDNDDTIEEPEYLFEDLDNVIKQYDFTKDEFITCGHCGKSLSDVLKYTNCCHNFVDLSTISSSLEKSYWVSFVDNPSRTINTLPNYTHMLFLQQGIPCQLRSLIWRKLILIDCQHTKNNVPKASKVIYKNFQHSYTASISKQISKDLCRTFPTVDFFKQESTIQELSTILNVYANYDVELGYCQGLLFLVGALHYHFQHDPILTFHSLCSIMESETELHNIFTTSQMSSTLYQWNAEFLGVLKQVDAELYEHMISFVEFQVFLFQWWLSFVSSHTPDLSIVNRIMEFCLIQGWKTGMFKISLGLLLANKPILMSLNDGDEEVVYQHLLNDSKWGIIINDLDMFFGDLLLSWDDSIFLNCAVTCPAPKATSHTRTGSVMEKLKGLSFNSNLSAVSVSSSGSRDRSNSGNSLIANQSSYSVFSHKNHDMESIYSDVTSTSSDDKPTFGDFLRLPKYFKHEKSEDLDLKEENQNLKELLKQSLDFVDDELKAKITQAIAS